MTARAAAYLPKKTASPAAPHRSSVPGHPTTTWRPQPPGVQFKLAVSQPSDALEHEADRIADRVLHMGDGTGGAFPLVAPAAGAMAPPVQRKCAACQEGEPELRQATQAKYGKRVEDEAIKGKHAKRTEDDEIKGKFTASPPPAGAQTEHGLSALGPGEPLAAAERAFFEPRFGHDFSQVRVHAGPEAAGVAQALNARALTRGRDIIFAAGQYAPGTSRGRHLLAHELAHVVQQGGGASDVVQRDLATPEPAVAPPPQPDLTEEEIKKAIAFNRVRFDATSTRLIQDLVGTEPTGTWTEDDIRAIASIQEQFGLKKDGMVGDETFRFLDQEVRAERLDRSDAHCLVSFAVFSERPVVGPVVGGSRSITVRFTMHARFPRHCRCADYEYRQFIRGHWRRERGGVVTDLGHTFSNFPGGGGLPAAWAEDGNTAAAALNYGHRTQPAEAINHYLDDTGAEDQANGCRYEGEDVPGGPDSVMPGDVFDIELNFRGEIRRRGRVVITKHWTPLRGRFPVP